MKRCRLGLGLLSALALLGAGHPVAAHPGGHHSGDHLSVPVPTIVSPGVADRRGTVALEVPGGFRLPRGGDMLAWAPPASPATPSAPTDARKTPTMVEHFQPFARTVRLRWDDRYLYVESQGIPEHPMMVGIRSWQQQVPLPQSYVGDNAWQIPRQPVPAARPLSTRNNFLRGAIALAVNGIPIFNPLNNRGDDAYLAGELDEFGGHCGRADDYHYHLPPIHLEKVVGPGQPIAYALDGYPIYGYLDPAHCSAGPLDALNGHLGRDGKYHYHATKTYPYLNGGFYGEVTERGGQVDPQPRAEPVRPALTPLRDARIVGFSVTEPDSYRLTYDVRGRQGTVSYTRQPDGAVRFTFVDTDGRSTSETYRPRRRGPGPGPGAGPNDRPLPPRGEQPRDRSGEPSPRTSGTGEAPRSTAGGMTASSFRVTCASLDSRGQLAVECTCDGRGVSPAIAWSGVPAGTRSLAVSLWHTAPDQEKSYWVVYNIPAHVTELPLAAQGIGTLGLNDRGRAAYEPPCSKGPGVKTYHVTVYALSAELTLAAGRTRRADLLAALRDRILATSTLDLRYERRRGG